MIALRCRSPRRTASPLQNPWRFLWARRLIPATTAMPSASAPSGAHQGTPSGPTSVKEQSAARAISITTIGSSAATRVPGLRGVVGSRPPQLGDPDGEPEARVEEVAQVADRRRPVERPPSALGAGGVDADVPCLAAGDQPDQLHRASGRGQHPDRGRVERVDEVLALAVDADDQAAVTATREDDADRLRVPPQPGVVGRGGREPLLDDPKRRVGLDLGDLEDGCGRDLAHACGWPRTHRL